MKKEKGNRKRLIEFTYIITSLQDHARRYD